MKTATTTAASFALMASFLLMLVSSVDAQNEQELAACLHHPQPFRAQALPRTEACSCDVNGTVCQPNDLCFSLPPDGSEEEFDQFDNATLPADFYDSFECLIEPCDDISGAWVYVDQDRDADTLTVVATVQIDQTNCEAELTVSTINATTTTYYADMTYQGVYLLHVFATKPAPGRPDYYDFEAGTVRNSSSFLQNSETTEPTCAFVGEFDGTSAFPKGLYRIAPNVSYEIGQVLTREEFPVDCPDGYPRAWTAATTSVTVTTSSAPAPMTGQNSTGPTASSPTASPPTMMGGSIPIPPVAATPIATTPPVTLVTASASAASAMMTNNNRATVVVGGVVLSLLSMVAVFV
jgi:hypothetical protein